MEIQFLDIKSQIMNMISEDGSGWGELRAFEGNLCSYSESIHLDGEEYRPVRRVVEYANNHTENLIELPNCTMDEFLDALDEANHIVIHEYFGGDSTDVSHYERIGDSDIFLLYDKES